MDTEFFDFLIRYTVICLAGLGILGVLGFVFNRIVEKIKDHIDPLWYINRDCKRRGK